MGLTAHQSATATLVSWIQSFRAHNEGRQPSRADFPPDMGAQLPASAIIELSIAKQKVELRAFAPQCATIKPNQVEFSQFRMS